MRSQREEYPESTRVEARAAVAKASAPASSWQIGQRLPPIAYMAGRFLGVTALAAGAVGLLHAAHTTAPAVKTNVAPPLQLPVVQKIAPLPMPPPPLMMVTYYPRLLADQMSPQLDELARYATVDPQRLCDAISPDDAAAWTESALFEGEWECIGTPRSARASGQRVFAMARSHDRELVQLVRFKINAATAAEANSAKKDLERRVSRLMQVMQWAYPSALIDLLGTLQPTTVDAVGTTFRLTRESSGGWNYNLVVNFPKTRSLVQARDYRTLQRPPSPGISDY